jgi:peroxiredoxin
MALVGSNTFENGKIAPDFTLIDTITDSVKNLEELKGSKGTIIMFICNHCPFVIHVNKELVKLANDFIPKGINFIAISSNDVNYYPQDGPIYMKYAALHLKYPFPYLFDESQKVAKAYNAACTPDFYLFDKNLQAVYHGQLDDSRPGNGIPVDGQDLRLAIANLLENKKNIDVQKPSIGCSIKWKD